MEYPFKDLLPLDEVLAREGYYKDWTHLDPEVFYSLTQISEYIKTKGYGVDVRLLIAQLAEHFGLKTTQVVDLANLLSTKHDALKDQFDVVIRDATSGADWGGEIVLARGGKATLGKRLDETTAQLAQTVRLDDSNLTLNNFTESDRAIIQGLADGDINAVLGRGNVVTENVADKAITPSKTTFIKSSSNIFNKDDVVIGKALSSTTGELVDNASFFTSNYIAVNPSSTYVSNRLQRTAFYDAGKSYISSGDFITTPFDTPINCFYIRVHGSLAQLSAKPQTNEGSTLLPYEEFKLSLSDTIKLTVAKDDILDGSIEIEKTNFIKRSTNMYNPKTTIDGYYLASATGELVAGGQYISTEFIVASSSHIAQAGFSRVIFYDKNKKYLGVENLTPAMSIIGPTPDGTEFIRLHIDKPNTVPKPQINRGQTLLPYEEYYLAIDGVRYEEHSEPKRIPSYYFPPEELSGEGYVASEGVYEQLTLEDLYAGYNALANANSEYITKTLLGKDASNTYDIYEYKLAPPVIEARGLQKTLPKIMLVANVHGYEKPSAYSLYYMVKAICEEWKNNPILEYLRFNVEFVFIPVLNPYGFVNGNYQNVNDVNIQTNFPVRWYLRTDDHTYGGSEPLSEIETILCKGMIDRNSDAMVFVDLHAQQPEEAGVSLAYSLIPDGIDYNLDIEVITKHLFEKLTRIYHKQYEQPVDEFAGRIVSREGAGTLDAYASSLGIPSTINEHFLRFKDESVNYSSDSIKANTEYLTNWVIVTLNRFKAVYNER